MGECGEGGKKKTEKCRQFAHLVTIIIHIYTSTIIYERSSNMIIIYVVCFMYESVCECVKKEQQQQQHKGRKKATYRSCLLLQQLTQSTTTLIHRKTFFFSNRSHGSTKPTTFVNGWMYVLCICSHCLLDFIATLKGNFKCYEFYINFFLSSLCTAAAAAALQ